MNISKVSEFLILPYTQNQKLRNLGDMSLTLNYDSSYKSRFKNKKKMNWDKNWKFLIGLKIKKKFWVFQLSNFAVYPRLETLKSQKLCLTPILTLAVIQDSKTPKNKLRRKLFRFRFDLGKKRTFLRFLSFWQWKHSNLP